jgi:hypothetical protein
MPLDEGRIDKLGKARLRLAMIEAPKKLPPAIAKVLIDDIFAWEEFGYRFGYYKQIAAMAEAVIAMPATIEDPPTLRLAY